MEALFAVGAGTDCRRPDGATLISDATTRQYLKVAKVLVIKVTNLEAQMNVKDGSATLLISVIIHSKT